MLQSHKVHLHNNISTYDSKWLVSPQSTCQLFCLDRQFTLARDCYLYNKKNELTNTCLLNILHFCTNKQITDTADPILSTVSIWLLQNILSLL